jgi:hypothetical protein
MSKINWDDVAVLESIANQCIYKGKEVGQARAALKAIYGYDIVYEDENDEQSINDKEILGLPKKDF